MKYFLLSGFPLRSALLVFPAIAMFAALSGCDKVANFTDKASDLWAEASSSAEFNVILLEFYSDT